jgi:hypothetical protein
MAKDSRVYKAVIKREVGLQELESAIASGGGIILRVDQRKGETVAFFAGREEARKGVKTAAAKLGQAEIKASSTDELAKLP